MDVTRIVNGKPANREELKSYVIKNEQILNTVKRVRKRINENAALFEDMADVGLG